MSAKKNCNDHAFQQSRRKVLKGLAAGVGAIALPASNASASVWDAFFQQHFRELNREDLTKVLERLEKEYSQEYSKKVSVSATPRLKGSSLATASTSLVALVAAVAFMAA